MRRELFAAVSHDLRTPITALGLLATAIDDEVVEDAKRREYAARMNTHVRALGALIDDLFDLTRLEAQGARSGRWSGCALDELVHDAVEAMQPGRRRRRGRGAGRAARAAARRRAATTSSSSACSST